MSLGALAPWLAVIEIVLALVITVLVVLQSKGSDMSAVTGGGDSGYRTKRGLEAALHKVTIYFAIAFFFFTILNFISWGQFAS